MKVKEVHTYLEAGRRDVKQVCAKQHRRTMQVLAPMLGYLCCRAQLKRQGVHPEVPIKGLRSCLSSDHAITGDQGKAPMLQPSDCQPHSGASLTR
jgi:hypothetical protein